MRPALPFDSPIIATQLTNKIVAPQLFSEIISKATYVLSFVLEVYSKFTVVYVQVKYMCQNRSENNYDRPIS